MRPSGFETAACLRLEVDVSRPPMKGNEQGKPQRCGRHAFFGISAKEEILDLWHSPVARLEMPSRSHKNDRRKHGPPPRPLFRQHLCDEGASAAKEREALDGLLIERTHAWRHESESPPLDKAILQRYAKAMREYARVLINGQHVNDYPTTSSENAAVAAANHIIRQSERQRIEDLIFGFKSWALAWAELSATNDDLFDMDIDAE